jgi:hypothetical protein
MNNRRKLPIALVAALFTLSAAACSSPTEPDPEIPSLPPAPPSSILLFDDFDGENRGGGYEGLGGQNNWTAFQNWNVPEGCVDLHGNGFYDVQRGNGLYVDLDGSCGRAGTLESKTEFSLTPGIYILEFWLAGNQRLPAPDTVQVTLGTHFSEQFVLNESDAFRPISRSLSVPAASTARLRFRNLGGDNQGALLDVVRLRRAQ